MTDRILIVDDDRDFRQILRNCYEGAGYDVWEAASGADARAILKAQSFNLVTVDVRLYGPDNEFEDGRLLGREIRSQYECGIIMLSVIDDQSERNTSLETWADDTIIKPFQVNELLARTRAVLRRYPSSGEREPDPSGKGSVAHFAGWALDEKRVELRSPQDTVVRVTMGDFQLLRNFLCHPHEVLSRDRIVELDTQIQSMSASDNDRAIDMRISRLRDRLNDDDKQLIRTVRGAGYMLAANVTWSPTPATTLAPPTPSTPSTPSTPNGQMPPPSIKRGRGDPTSSAPQSS